MTTHHPQLPVLDAETGFFWTSGADGVLRIQRCAHCGHWQHPPLPRCAVCQSAEVAPRATGGRGRVASFTVNMQKWSADMTVPFVFGVVELAEQDELYVFSRLCVPPGDMVCGMHVAVRFERHEDVWLPLFAQEDRAR